MDAITFATVALALLTAALVGVTWYLAVETKRMRRLQSEPEVLVSLEPNQHINFFDLVIENVGKGTAYDIQIKLTSNNKLSGHSAKKSLLDNPLYKIRTLKPGAKIVSFIAKWDEITPPLVTWKVSFKSKNGELLEVDCAVDLSSYGGYGKLGTPYLETIARELKAFREDWGWILRSSRRLPVDVYLRADREIERKEMEEEFAEMRDRMEKEKAKEIPKSEDPT